MSLSFRSRFFRTRPVEYFSGFAADAFDPRGFLPGAAPYWWQATGGSPAVVLCLHGFSATPYETQPIARACVERGIDAVAPLLPGHGYAEPKVAKKESRRTRAREWLVAAGAELAQCLSRYETVFVYGQSMGGLLTLTLAATPKVKACAVTGVALMLPLHARVLSRLLSLPGMTVPKKPREVRHENPQYRFHCARGVRQIDLLAARVRRRVLPQVRCPVFVAHSHQDRLISAKVVHVLQQKLGGPAEVHWYDRCGHTMALDVEGPRIAADIAWFFRERLDAVSGTPAGPPRSA